MPEPLLSVDEALKTILAHAKHSDDTVVCSLKQALGKVLAIDQYAAIDVPPADNSAMDGYAINTQDLVLSTDDNWLQVSQTITAGDQGVTLSLGTAARIFTGAEIPPGANAVVMQEQCQLKEGKVCVPNDIAIGNNIRPRGQDIKAGTCILPRGKRLTAADIGLLASVGIDHIDVYRPLRIAILSTGNELLEPGTPPLPGKIYNSNRYLLHNLLQQQGWEVVDCGVVEDTLIDTKTALLNACEADCILSTGGVSVGDEDHVKAALSEMGELNLWRIALKPGKPLAFGQISGHIKNTPFLGLPGNPVSAYITFCLFVLPFLKTCQGQAFESPSRLRYQADFCQKANPKRQEYVRVTIDHVNAQVSAFGNQSSGVLSSIVASDGLAIVPINTTVNRGDILDVIPFHHFFA